MTPAVTKTIRSRPGNGSPDATVAGTASAAASDTAPRKPATPLTIAPAGADAAQPLLRAPVERADHVRHGEQPGEAHADDHGRDDGHGEQPAARSMLVSPRTADWTSSPTSTKRAPLSR